MRKVIYVYKNSLKFEHLGRFLADRRGLLSTVALMLQCCVRLSVVCRRRL